MLMRPASVIQVSSDLGGFQGNTSKLRWKSSHCLSATWLLSAAARTLRGQLAQYRL